MAYWKIATPPDNTKFTDSVISYHLGLGGAALDSQIAYYRDAAIKWVEDYLNIAVFMQTIQEYLDSWPDTDTFQFSVGQVAGVDTFTYKDTNNGDQDLLTSTGFTYEIESFTNVCNLYIVPTPGLSPFVFPVNARVGYPNSLCVTYTSGVGELDFVDYRIREAILLMIGFYYRNNSDSTVGSIQFPEVRSAQMLLDSCRRNRI